VKRIKYFFFQIKIAFRLSLINCEFVENVRHVEDVDLTENPNLNEGNQQDREEIMRLQQEAREIKYLFE
jgi:hypothetical protein